MIKIKASTLALCGEEGGDAKGLERYTAVYNTLFLDRGHVILENKHRG